MTRTLLSLALMAVSLGSAIWLSIWGAVRLRRRHRDDRPFPYRLVIPFLAVHALIDTVRLWVDGPTFYSVFGIAATVVVLIAAVRTRRVVRRLADDIVHIRNERERTVRGWLLHHTDLAEQRPTTRDFGGDPNELPPWARPRRAIDPGGHQ